MIFRKAHRSEVQAVAELWVHSFPSDRPLAERLNVLETAGKYGGIETVVVAEENGRLAAALKTTSYTQYLAGTALPMLGLAAVGVAPWARRRGLATALCSHALEGAYRRGDVVSVLYPFRPEFYHRLGWALVGELHAYLFAPEQLADSGDPHVRLAGPTDRAAIAGCYQRVAGESNGLIERDEYHWRKHLDAPFTYAWVPEGSVVSGYMIVRYGRTRSPSRRPLYVREVVAEDVTTYDRMFGWVSRQRDLWRRVRYEALPSEHFGQRLIDPRPPDYNAARALWADVARILRGPMIRLINLREAFTRRKRWNGGPVSFSLEVDDAQLVQNKGRWRVDFDGRMVNLSQPPGSFDHEVALVVDVATLAQLYAGELSVSAAIRLGRARARGAIDSLDEFFRPHSPFQLLDEF
jgi:predicted acetyltransferase